jgi:hypothetical protein
MLFNTPSHKPLRRVYNMLSFPSRTTSRRVCGVLTVLALGQGVVTATAAHAQSVTTPTTSANVSTFTRYEPFACAKVLPRRMQDANGVDVLSWRDRWPDTATVRFVSTGEKEQPEILAEARACLSRFSVATTRRSQLMGLGIAYLGVEDMTNARAAFDRYLAEGDKQLLERRARDLVLVAKAYTDAQRVPELRAYLAQLDALGPGAAGFRLKAHNKFYALTAGMDSIPLMDAEVRAARAAIRELQGDAQQAFFDDWDDAVFNALDLEGRRGNYEEIKKIQQEALRAWEPVRPMHGPVQFARTDMKTRALRLGKIAPQMQAEYVFMPGKVEPLTTPLPLPARGKLSLFISFAPGALTADIVRQHRQIATLRKKYPPSVLDIVVVTPTGGIDWNQLKMLKTEEEIEQLREFYFDYMKLPVPLSIRVQPYTINPTDGRRERTELHDYYIDEGEVLVDKNGIVRFLRGGGKRLDNMIEELK